jgi:hypothetical protein
LCDNPAVLAGMMRILVVGLVVLVAAMFVILRGERADARAELPAA